MSSADPIAEQLLNRARLGRGLLLWQQRRAETKVVYPLGVRDSTPNPGLTNQIFSLVGCCLLANLSGASLVLPNFTSGGGGGAIRFADLFDARHFARAMQGVVSVGSPAAETNPRLVHRLSGDRGWLLYKAYQDLLGHAVAKGERAAIALLEQIELRTLHALQLSHDLHTRVRSLTSELLGDSPYGCIHARLEHDMQRSVQFNRAGTPPKLEDYLDASWAGRFAVVRKTPRIFVPVGLELDETVARRMQLPTDWNATLVRKAHLTRSSLGARCHAPPADRPLVGATWQVRTAHLTRPKPTSRAPSHHHTVAALIDMAICRRARWVMGWSGSTYARLLGLYQQLDHSRSYFVACPGMGCAVDTGRQLLRHSFCKELAQPRSHKVSRSDMAGATVSRAGVPVVTVGERGQHDLAGSAYDCVRTNSHAAEG